MTDWKVLSAESPTEEEFGVLTSLVGVLMESTSDSVVSAVGYSDVQRTSTSVVYIVSVLADDYITGTVYRHPGHVIVCVLSDHEPAPDDLSFEEEFEAFLSSMLEEAK